jgi:hypothetical protein
VQRFTADSVPIENLLEQADFTRINKVMIELARSRISETDGQDSDTHDAGGPITHQGKLILDATCTPTDSTYPTDLKLLNEGREKLEKVIDILNAPPLRASTRNHAHTIGKPARSIS